MRRIFTDGRAWPAQLPGASVGYSIGRWIDTDGNGRYDTLEVETRGINGTHVYDSDGAPFHPDNGTIVKERISLDEGQCQDPAQRDHHDRRRAHTAVDGDAELSARSRGLGRVRLLGIQPACRDRT